MRSSGQVLPFLPYRRRKEEVAGGGGAEESLLARRISRPDLDACLLLPRVL